MKIILFGATGMIGQGVLLAARKDPRVEKILCVGRTATGVDDPKVTDVVHADMFDISPIQAELAGYDACLFCLGVSSFRMSEADYRRMTFDLTLSVARTLLAANRDMNFLYVSGSHTDAASSQMWARVKGETENALLGLGFRGAYMFRPGFIQPLDGARSKTPLYRTIYSIVSPLYPLLRRVARRNVTTTVENARAMLNVAANGCAQHVIESADLEAIAAA